MNKLVYFSPVFWSSYKQRPHFIVEYFLQKGYEVLWVEPYPTRLPKIMDLFRRATLFNQETPRPKNLTLLKLTVLPIEPLFVFNRLNAYLSRKSLSQLNGWLQEDTILGIGKPSFMALEFLKKHQGYSFYDVMDDLPAFHRGTSRLYLQWLVNQIAQKVTQVFVSSSSLAEKFKLKKIPVIKVLNALDSDALPIELATENKTIILGYIGSIADWFDWDLVLNIAKQYPQLTIQLIGPVFTLVPKKMPNNIALLGPIAHSDLAQHLREFTIGLIPFKLNELTKSVDPIKYYEYKAMGLPIVSTHFGEMANRVTEAGVFIIDNTNIRQVIDQVLQFKSDRDSCVEFKRLNSWHKRLTVLDALIFNDNNR